jgi:hypothetical protein
MGTATEATEDVLATTTRGDRMPSALKARIQ